MAGGVIFVAARLNYDSGDGCCRQNCLDLPFALWFCGRVGCRLLLRGLRRWCGLLYRCDRERDRLGSRSRYSGGSGRRMVRRGILAPDRIGRQRGDTQKDYYRPAPHGGIHAYAAVTRKLCGPGNTRLTSLQDAAAAILRAPAPSRGHGIRSTPHSWHR
jgi:hypothetical protein